MQVVTDTRLWLYKQLQLIQSSLHDLIRASVARSEQDVDVIMPGYTHLQVPAPALLLSVGGCLVVRHSRPSAARLRSATRHR